MAAPAGECIQKYKSGQIMTAEEGGTLGPYVSIKFGSGGGEITVSNHSSSATNPQHCAVIKSFELGHSDGVTCRVTIHDTQGGSFVEFMKHLLSDWMCLKGNNSALVTMEVKFGWVKQGCYGTMGRAVSPSYYVICDSVETNFSQGKYMFEITGKDIGFRMFEGGAEMNDGGEGDQGMYLYDLIQKLAVDGVAPNVGKVSIKRIDEGGNIKTCPNDIMFLHGDNIEKRRGRRTKEQSCGQNKIESIRRWLDTSPSLNGKFWIPQYDCTNPVGELVWWEDSRPNDGARDDSYWEQRCLGTFIVNGSKRSNVIEFNPKIRWDFAATVGMGGHLGDLQAKGLDGQGSKNTGTSSMPRSKTEGAGQTQQSAASDSMKDIFGGAANQITAECEAQSKRTITILDYGQITGDLVIVGSPNLCTPKEAIQLKCVSIIVINPFHISSSKNNSCGEWLATPACNEVLSNKAWIVESVTHRIEAGAYTTILGVRLTMPGIHIPADQPIGAWTGGWRPVAVCS